MSLKSEIFLLRDEKGPILFAPLKEISLRINEAGVGAVARKMKGMEPVSGDEELLSLLDEHDFFSPCEVPALNDKPPIHVTLFPTDGCNLRCRYCYAGAEKQRHVMSEEIGKHAIDLVIRNALAQKQDHFEVSFHGNGEPFTAFEVVKALTEYAVDRAEESGLSCWLSATSNGVMPEATLDWVIAYMDDITISFDVLENLQNYQRPMAGERPSFSKADHTLRRLDAAGKKYSIRTTLTKDSISSLVPLSMAVLERYPHCHILHVEPCWESGRSLSTGTQMPQADRFVAEFLKASAVLKGKMQLVYSADRLNYKDIAFCGVPRGSFTVTAEGLVTSCYEVCESSNPCAERYIYGRWNEEDKTFAFDEKKLEALRGLTVEQIPYCQDCFCKYSCCGDCPAKLLGSADTSEHKGSPRCTITRALTLARIAEQLDEMEERKNAE